LTPAKAQSTPSSEGKDELSLGNFHHYFPTFAPFACFARDIPNFGCGSAALGSLWLNLFVSFVAALPRCVSAVLQIGTIHRESAETGLLPAHEYATKVFAGVL
jgi:hypothetical protein